MREGIKQHLYLGRKDKWGNSTHDQDVAALFMVERIFDYWENIDKEYYRMLDAKEKQEKLASKSGSIHGTDDERIFGRL